MADNYLPEYRPPAAPLPPLALQESRERAVKLLSDGYAYDRLSESEFEWRLGRLNGMESPAAVDALVADLLAAAPQNAAVAGGRFVPERRMLTVMSNSHHTGVWMVPAKLDVAAVMSEVKLDLRYATIPATCTIDISAVMANVAIIVPPGMPVHFEVGAFMGSTRNDAAPAGYAFAGMPFITVKGYAFMAEVRVKVREMGR
jgi:hypothetical protein